MSKRKPKRPATPSRDDSSAITPAVVEGAPFESPALPWSKSTRRLASVLIIGYLLIVLIGPLSNPVSSQHFSAPIAEKLSPIHRALFLGHGYRFFAPDPGPSHLLVYRGVRADGTRFEGQFPDREKHWPRLQYHRWFMLSETMFNEQIMKPTAAQFALRSEEYDLEIEHLRKSGKLELLEKLTRERDDFAARYDIANRRLDALAESIASVLLQQNQGDSIELYVQERQIPFPEDVANGLRLDDENLLSEMVKIGEMDSSGYRALELEQLPVQESSE